GSRGTAHRKRTIHKVVGDRGGVSDCRAGDGPRFNGDVGVGGNQGHRRVDDAHEEGGRSGIVALRVAGVAGDGGIPEREGAAGGRQTGDRDGTIHNVVG